MQRLSFEYNSRAFINYIDKENKWSELESELSKKIGINYKKTIRNMETEIRIKVPEGMIIDKENSTFECIKFKPKNVTYDDVLKSMVPYTQIVNTTLRHQRKCITFRKLLEIAEYINGDWKPDWDNKEQCKYIICYNHETKQFGTDFYSYTSITPIVFPSEENAKKAVEIIGEEELKKFFSNQMVY